MNIAEVGLSLAELVAKPSGNNAVLIEKKLGENLGLDSI